MCFLLGNHIPIGLAKSYPIIGKSYPPSQLSHCFLQKIDTKQNLYINLFRFCERIPTDCLEFKYRLIAWTELLWLIYRIFVFWPKLIGLDPITMSEFKL